MAGAVKRETAATGVTNHQGHRESERERGGPGNGGAAAYGADDGEHVQEDEKEAAKRGGERGF